MTRSDRERYFSHSESIHIDARPQAVWDVVSDITRTGEWSPVCQAAWWKDPATGPQVGAWFHGRNEDAGRVWETESLVISAEAPVEFTWVVRGNAVRWSYTLAPAEGGTTLTESWAVQPGGFEFFAEKFGDLAEAELEKRRHAALSGIPVTLAAIKRIVESG